MQYKYPTYFSNCIPLNFSFQSDKIYTKGDLLNKIAYIIAIRPNYPLKNNHNINRQKIEIQKRSRVI